MSANFPNLQTKSFVFSKKFNLNLTTKKDA